MSAVAASVDLDDHHRALVLAWLRLSGELANAGNDSSGDPKALPAPPRIFAARGPAFRAALIARYGGVAAAAAVAAGQLEAWCVWLDRLDDVGGRFSGLSPLTGADQASDWDTALRQVRIWRKHVTALRHHKPTTGE